MREVAIDERLIHVVVCRVYSERQAAANAGPEEVLLGRQMNDVLPEILDPFSLRPVADGEEGELVFTSLTKQAMPVVRYRTRDLTRLLPGTAYPAFRRMQKVTGRTDDMMIVRGVNVFPTQVEEQILAVEGLSPHYLCVLTRPGNMDELTVRVEAAGDGDHDRDAMAADLARRVKHRIGVTVRVEVVDRHGLERSLGKAKRISDQRPK